MTHEEWLDRKNACYLRREGYIVGRMEGHDDDPRWRPSVEADALLRFPTPAYRLDNDEESQ